VMHQAGICFDGRSLLTRAGRKRAEAPPPGFFVSVASKGLGLNLAGT